MLKTLIYILLYLKFNKLNLRWMPTSGWGYFWTGGWIECNSVMVCTYSATYTNHCSIHPSSSRKWMDRWNMLVLKEKMNDKNNKKQNSTIHSQSDGVWWLHYIFQHVCIRHAHDMYGLDIMSNVGILLIPFQQVQNYSYSLITNFNRGHAESSFSSVVLGCANNCNSDYPSGFCCFSNICRTLAHCLILMEKF